METQHQQQMKKRANTQKNEAAAEQKEGWCVVKLPFSAHSAAVEWYPKDQIHQEEDKEEEDDKKKRKGKKEQWRQWSPYQGAIRIPPALAG